MKKALVKKILIVFLIIAIFLILLNQLLYVLRKEEKEAYDTTVSEVLKSLEKWKEDNEDKIKGSIIVNKTVKELIDEKYLNNEISIDNDTNFCIVNDNGEYKYLKDDGNNCGEVVFENVNMPSKPYNEFLYSEEVKVTFSEYEGLEYYIKSTRGALLNINTYFSCGNGISPSSCKQIKTTKNIKADIWYKVSGNVDVMYDEHADSEATLYALVTDNVKFKNISTMNISKIDRKEPVIVLDSAISSTNSISVKIEDMIDNDTDIASSICRYGTQEGEYKTVSMSNTRGRLSKCIINYKLKDKIYYYQVCATDKVGNVGCAFGSSLIESIKNPVITYKENEVNIFYNSSKNMNYYIKSDVELTIDKNTVSYCGKSFTPAACIESKTKTLLPNVWYEVNNDINVTYKKNGVITATIYDGKKFVTSSANIKFEK